MEEIDMGAELEGFGYVLGKIYNCNKETVLSMEDTLDVLPDGEDAEWFALMLRYTGLRIKASRFYFII